MEPHELPASRPAPRLSVAARPPSTEETFTYSLCLLGSLQHFAYSAAGAHIKEIPLQLDSAVRQVSCGLDWLCLLTDAGHVYSFGSNTYGQLAQGHTHAVAHPKPILFSVDKRIARISCGAAHGGFLLDTGALFIFGCGTYGRLGTGNETTQSSPVAVKMRWKELEAAAAKLSREPRSTIPGFARTNTASAAAHSAMASAPDPAVPIDKEEADDDVVFADISCGDRHTLLLGAKPSATSGKKVTKNHIIAFGDGMNGRLGLGTERDQATGALLTQFQTSIASYTPTFVHIHAGSSHSAAVSTAGELFTWGSGADGQLGHDTTESEWLPREVQFFRGHTMASAKCGAKHTVAISRTGIVYAWGRGVEGQLGTGAIVAATARPQRIALVVDPVAAQQAHIEAQLAAGASFSASSAGSSLVLPDTRVVVRSIVARDNMAMALDEQSRLFVWGDNGARQLGLPPPVENTPDHVATPKQLAYMGLREPKKLVSRVRDRVLGAATASLPRVGLVHVDASDRFSLLVFRTKQPALGQGVHDDDPSSGSVGSVTRRLMRQRSTIVYNLEDKVRWQLSLTEPLELKEVPSREAAFYDYMARYKVSIGSSDPATDHKNDENEEGTGEPASPERRRASAGISGYHGKRRSSIMALAPDVRTQLQDHFRCEDDADEMRSPRSTADVVRGYDAWLVRQCSPPKAHGFCTARRFPPPQNQKEEDATRVPMSTTKSLPRRPRPPKSAFGRAVLPSSPRSSINMGPTSLPRRPTTASSAAASISEKDNEPPPPCKHTRQRLFNQFVAPFGSSVASRFGVQSPRANDSVQLDLHPDDCASAVLPRSPRAILNSNAEHFSQVIARRLEAAKGAHPGPGTYDRHGG